MSLTGWSDWLQNNGLVCGIGLVLSIGTVAGCGRTAPPAAESTTETAETSTGKGDTPAKSTAGSNDPGVASASKSTKQPMIDGIPLDVWFQNPIAESKVTGTVTAPAVAATTTEKVPATAGPTPTPEPEKQPTAAGGGDWASILPIDDLQSEVKKIKLELSKHLGAVQQYNAHYKEIAMDGAVLSVLAGIALVHPEKVSWKDHAAHVRDIASEMAKKSKGLGQKPFDETKKEFEKIDGLLSGNPPPDLPEAPPDLPFSEFASRRGIMQRLQVDSDFLRANFQTEAVLTKDFEKAAQAASVVAAVTKVIGTEGYASADEEEYQAFVTTMLNLNLAMAKAAREKDFATFSDANGKVGKTCGECHTAYQGSSN